LEQAKIILHLPRIETRSKRSQ